MQRGVKILLVAVFFVSMLAASSNLAALQTQDMSPDITNVMSWDDDLKLVVIIDQAYYDDYDEDEVEDDVVTSFRVLITDEYNYVLGGDYDFILILNISTELTLPSGQSYNFDFQITTSNGVGITLGWVNYVTESGWYEFSVDAVCINSYITPDRDSVEFDPPELDPGNPEIDMVLKQL